MPDIRIIDEYMPSKEPQSMRGYVINGHMPYARPEDTVICILGGPVFHLNEQFMAFAETLGYAWERRLCYIEAEENKAVGWIAKSPMSDVNDGMPFMEKWGLSVDWAVSGWIARTDSAAGSSS